MAVPFHSTATSAEAEGLVVLHCPLGYDGDYRIRVDWPDDDIRGALASARRQFDLGDE